MKRSTPLCRHIGGKVRFFRKKRGMTQEELAARLQTRGCNITRAMVGHIETGYRTSPGAFDTMALQSKPQTAPGGLRAQGGWLPCTH